MSTLFSEYIDDYIEKNADDPMWDQIVASKIMAMENACKDQGFRRLRHSDIFRSDENILVKRHKYAVNSMMPHCHDYFELIYVARGVCKQIINGNPCHLSEGDICLLTPNDKHSVYIEKREFQVFNILIKKELFKESFLTLLTDNDLLTSFFLDSLYSQPLNNSYLHFTKEDSEAYLSFIEALIKEFYEKKTCYKKSIECYLALLFTELLRIKKVDSDPENNVLTAIIAYINEHKTDATLSMVAEYFHYHPNYLSSLIKRYTQKNFSDLVQEARLNEACYYLTETTLSIENIYQILGYYDRSYFNRVFKKNYQISPSEYRKRKASHK